MRTVWNWVGRLILSITVYKIRYHFVTAVKYRKVLLKPKVEDCIRETMKGINERCKIIIDELGFDGDHIHIFCGAKPQYSSSADESGF